MAEQVMLDRRAEAEYETAWRATGDRKEAETKAAEAAEEAARAARRTRCPAG